MKAFMYLLVLLIMFVIPLESSMGLTNKTAKIDSGRIEMDEADKKAVEYFINSWDGKEHFILITKGNIIPISSSGTEISVEFDREKFLANLDHGGSNILFHNHVLEHTMGMFPGYQDLEISDFGNACDAYFYSQAECWLRGHEPDINLQTRLIYFGNDGIKSVAYNLADKRLRELDTLAIDYVNLEPELLDRDPLAYINRQPKSLKKIHTRGGDVPMNPIVRRSGLDDIKTMSEILQKAALVGMMVGYSYYQDFLDYVDSKCTPENLNDCILHIDEFQEFADNKYYYIEVHGEMDNPKE